MKLESWAIWVKGDVDGETVRVRVDPSTLDLSKIAALHTKEKITLGKEKPGKKEV